MLFIDLCKILERIAEDRGRLRIISILSELFSNISPNEAKIVSYLIIGQIAPPYVKLELGVSSNTILNALSQVSGIDKTKLENMLRRVGDIGDLTYKVLENRKLRLLDENRYLSLDYVFNILHKIARDSSIKVKTDLLVSLFGRISSLEGKYLARLIVNKTRVAIGVATVLDSLATAKNLDKERVRKIYYMTSDIGETTYRILSNNLDIDINLYRPIQPALAERVKDSQEMLEKSPELFVEYKYDGFRIQLHKGDDVKIFSRKLEDITDLLPEIVEDSKKYPGKFIVEGEAVSILDGKPLPFQEIIKRKRKYNIDEYIDIIPIHVYLFDILYLDGQKLIDLPFRDRRAILENFVNNNFSRLKLSYGKYTSSKQEIDDIFQRSIAEHMEGIIGKKPDAPYTPGQRNHNWMKLKHGKDTIDAVIVGYFYGQGRLKGYPGSLLICVYDEDNDEYQTIAKVSSGLSEEELIELSNKLIATNRPGIGIVSNIEPDVWVEPDVVVEVTYDEITLSPVHTCAKDVFKNRGLALRFPRIIRIRDDKSIYEVTRVSEMISLYKSQGPRRQVELEEKEESF